MSSSHPPRPTRLGRLADYLAKAFPPVVLVPATVAHALSIDWGTQALASPEKVIVDGRTVASAVSVLAFTLLLRVQDELKDVESDQRLGKAGDPRYKDRPIVTGHVLPADFSALWWWLVGVLVVANAALGPLVWGAAAGAFVLCWLSLHWFFWPGMSRYLLVAFITHNPLSLAIAGYAVAVAASRGMSVQPMVAMLLVGTWLPVAAWETARKVRLPEEETDYVTYSKVLGWKVAAVVPALFVAGSLAALVTVVRAAGLSPVVLGVLGVAAAVPVVACLRLRFAPAPGRAKLQPAAEVYAGVVVFALAIGFAVARGLVIRGPA